METRKIPEIGDKITIHDGGGHVNGLYAKPDDICTIAAKTDIKSDFFITCPRLKSETMRYRLFADEKRAEVYKYEEKWQYVNMEEYELTY